MQKKWVRPIATITLALLIVGGVLWIINPTSGPLTYLASPASARDNLRYAAKPAGWDSPAGACVVCHSLEKGIPWRTAPGLWGIVGAPKANARGFGYSLALAQVGGSWTVRELDEYLAYPTRFLPGTSKTISVADPEERARIIKYLGTLRD